MHLFLKKIYRKNPFPKIYRINQCEVLNKPFLNDYFEDSVKLVVNNKYASTKLLQKELKLSHKRAQGIIAQMEKLGIIGTLPNRLGRREVLVAGTNDLENLFNKIGLRKLIGEFTDDRDGQVYKTVKLKDGNTWMAQNLNFDVGEGCSFYDNDPELGGIYGRLYTWDAAMKACPEGWRLPSNKEVDSLFTAYGNKSYKALIIKDGDSGFAALLGGSRISDGEFYNLGLIGYYWSATEKGAEYAWHYYFGSGNGGVGRFSYNKEYGVSCRCLKD